MGFAMLQAGVSVYEAVYGAIAKQMCVMPNAPSHPRKVVDFTGVGRKFHPVSILNHHRCG